MKRICVVLLCLALCLSALSACGSGAFATSESASLPASSQQAEASFAASSAQPESAPRQTVDENGNGPRLGTEFYLAITDYALQTGLPSMTVLASFEKCYREEGELLLAFMVAMDLEAARAGAPTPYNVAQYEAVLENTWEGCTSYVIPRDVFTGMAKSWLGLNLTYPLPYPAARGQYTIIVEDEEAQTVRIDIPEKQYGLSLSTGATAPSYYEGSGQWRTICDYVSEEGAANAGYREYVLAENADGTYTLHALLAS